MKHSILVLAVALACLVAAPTALAQSRVGCDPGGPTPGGAGFFARGTVSAVDTTGDLLTVTVTKGSDGLPTPLVVTILHLLMRDSLSRLGGRRVRRRRARSTAGRHRTPATTRSLSRSRHDTPRLA